VAELLRSTTCSGVSRKSASTSEKCRPEPFICQGGQRGGVAQADVAHDQVAVIGAGTAGRAQGEVELAFARLTEQTGGAEDLARVIGLDAHGAAAVHRDDAAHDRRLTVDLCAEGAVQPVRGGEIPAKAGEGDSFRDHETVEGEAERAAGRAAAAG
jgi:hypothetical protein